MTARGMVRRGLRASWPRVVADSKPAKLKRARTTPRRTPEGVTAWSWSWGRSMWGTVAQEQGGDDENDYGDGGSLDPEHEAGGGLDVAIGEGGRRGGGAESDDRAGDGMGLGG
jgi:hypothetical protein